jgi:enoyl-CoA hydratase/carnithine racemase
MVFNNPERRNAVSLDMWAAIPDIMDAFEQDQSVRLIVLRDTGGKAFVSGADISQFETARASAESVAAYDRVTEQAGRRLTGTAKPTIAMIEGYCIGGGLGIAIGCDLRLAAAGARFGVPAAKLGLGYGGRRQTPARFGRPRPCEGNLLYRPPVHRWPSNAPSTRC